MDIGSSGQGVPELEDDGEALGRHVAGLEAGGVALHPPSVSGCVGGYVMVMTAVAMIIAVLMVMVIMVWWWWMVATDGILCTSASRELHHFAEESFFFFFCARVRERLEYPITMI